MYSVLADDHGLIHELIVVHYSAHPMSWNELKGHYDFLVGVLPQRIKISIISRPDKDLNKIYQAYIARGGSFVDRVKFLSRTQTQTPSATTSSCSIPSDHVFDQYPRDYFLTLSDGDNNVIFLRSKSKTLGQHAARIHNQMMPCELILHQIGERISSTDLIISGGNMIPGRLPDGKGFLLIHEDLIDQNVALISPGVGTVNLRKKIAHEIKLATGTDLLIWLDSREWPTLSEKIIPHLDLCISLGGHLKGKQRVLVPYVPFGDERFLICEPGVSVNDAAVQDILQLHQLTWDSFDEKISSSHPKMQVLRVPGVFHIMPGSLPSKPDVNYLTHLNCLIERTGARTTLYMPSYASASATKASIEFTNAVKAAEKELERLLVSEKYKVVWSTGRFSSILRDQGSLRCLTHVVFRK